MSSREEILKRVNEAQPVLIPLPEPLPLIKEKGSTEKFRQVLESIGGRTVLLNNEETIQQKIEEIFPEAKRVVSSVQSLDLFFLKNYQELDGHSLEDVDIAIIEAKFGVAENGAVWVTEDDMKMRALPFIAENLVMLLNAESIMPTMQEAYNLIGSDPYGFGVFIAGPSKTADIEQSLVLGAHGPKSMTVFIRYSVS